jgi:hypothetical protein
MKISEERGTRSGQFRGGDRVTGRNRVVSIITKESAEALDLASGKEVYAVIKRATS